MNPLQLIPAINFIERHMPHRRESFPGRQHNLPDDDWIGVHDQWGQHWQQGRERMLSGIDGLMAALGVTISTDKTTYKVGERPTYRISGGVPRGHVAWSSFKNGVSTGEFQEDYPGEDLNDAGTLTIQGAPWSASDVGDWQKQILIVPEGYAENPDYGSLATAQVEFTVVGAGQASTTPVAQQSSGAGGILNQKITLPVLGSVPVIAVAGVGIVGVFLLMGSGGKR